MSNPIHTHWTPKARNSFLAALRNGKTVSQAATITGLSRETAYRLRRRNPRFALAWSLALDIAQVRRLVDLEAERRFQAYFRIPANMRFCDPAAPVEPRVVESNIFPRKPAETRNSLHPVRINACDPRPTKFVTPPPPFRHPGLEPGSPSAKRPD